MPKGSAFSYGDRPALRDVTIHLRAGSVTALIGPNGSGKTTLLHVLAGLIDPAAGTVEGPDRVAYMPHQHGIGIWMPLTVREVIGMGHYRFRGLVGRLTAADRRRVRDAAELLEVTDLLGRQFGELSAGQRQRVLMAQIITQEGDLLLLDEPITGLDLASQGRILEVINAETRQGCNRGPFHAPSGRGAALRSRGAAGEPLWWRRGRRPRSSPPRSCRPPIKGGSCRPVICCGPEPECCGPPAAGEECCEHPADRLLVLDDHAHGHGEHDERAHT